MSLQGCCTQCGGFYRIRNITTRLYEESFRYAWEIGVILLELRIVNKGNEDTTNSGLKLFLHCGESLRLSNTSVKDAYAAGTYRAGHAFNLYRFPATMEKYIEDDITVEVCLVSNLSLRDIRKICERSIRAGGLSEEETDHLLKVWQRAWNDFCAGQLQKA